MKHLIFTAGFLAALSSLPAPSYAVPVKFADCAKSTKITAPKNASGVYFNETCDTAYVLPPETGSLQFFGLRPTGNVELVCKQYNDIEEAITSNVASIKMFNQRIESYSQKAQEYMDNLEEGLVPVGMTIEEVEEKIDDLILKADIFRKHYDETFQSLKGMKAYYAMIEGAVGKFMLESKYNQLVEEYQKKNPSVHFVRMPLEQSYIMINEKAHDPVEDPLNFPMEAVLSLTSPMADYIPLLKQIRDPQPTEIAPPQTPGGIFTDGLSGNIQLSASACARSSAIPGCRSRSR